MPATAVWSKTCQTLKRELGDATFGSWLGHAALREQSEREVCLVAATGVARDWIRRHAWRRIGELWAQNDPEGRALELRSRMEFEAAVPATVVAEVVAQAPAVGGPQVVQVGSDGGLDPLKAAI